MGTRLKKVSILLAVTLLVTSFSSADSASAAKKPKPKPKVLVSPSPKWPPAGFSYQDGVYAKVPTSRQLVSIISAKRSLATQVKECAKFVCGAVQVASDPGCLWWEVDSHVFSQEKVLLGKLKTSAGTTAPQEIKTVLLISPEPIETLEFITDIEVICHQDPKPSDIKKSSYTKVAQEPKDDAGE
jgi:hypothetical protein